MTYPMKTPFRRQIIQNTDSFRFHWIVLIGNKIHANRNANIPWLLLYSMRELWARRFLISGRGDFVWIAYNNNIYILTCYNQTCLFYRNAFMGSNKDTMFIIFIKKINLILTIVIIISFNALTVISRLNAKTFFWVIVLHISDLHKINRSWNMICMTSATYWQKLNKCINGITNINERGKDKRNYILINSVICMQIVSIRTIILKLVMLLLSILKCLKIDFFAEFISIINVHADVRYYQEKLTIF